MRIALAILLAAAPCWQATAAVETYGNFETLGVVLRPPAPLTADTVGAVRLYQVRPQGERLLQSPVRVATFDYFAGSVFNLEPGTTNQYRADYYNLSGGLAASESFSGATRPEPGPTPAALQEIYVAPTGNDAYAGTQAQPKRTIAAAFAAATLPGTHIVIRRGTYYEGTIYPPDVGTEEAPTVIRAYPGEAVIIDGSDPSMLQSGWSSVGGGYYERLFSGQTWLVAFRNKVTGQTFRCFPVRTLAELSGRYSGQPANTFTKFNITGAYYCSGNTMRIYCPTFTGSGNIEMRVSVRGTGIEHGGDHHVIYEGLTFRWFQSMAIYDNASDDVTVRNCTFEYNNTPIGIKRAANRLLVENCTFVDDCNRWGFLPKSDDGYNYSGYIETGALTVHWPYDGRGIVMRHNAIRGLFDGVHLSPAGLSPVPDTSETDFYDNTIDAACDDLMELDGFARNVRVFRNRMSDFLSGISIAQAVHGPTYVLYNDMRRHGQSTSASISGFQGYPVKSNGGTDYGNTGEVFFYHNTTWTDVPSTPAWRVQYANWQRLTMANNIWQGTATNWWSWQTYLDPIYMPRDILYAPLGPFLRINGIGSFNTVASVAGAPSSFQFLTNALNANPMLAAPAATNWDFTLAAGSPAIDSGVILPGINDLSYSGGGPDLGAHEVGGGVAVRFSPDAATVPEGTTNVDLNVILLPPVDQAVTVNYAVSGGSASNGSDYVLSAGMLTFSPQETNHTIAVALLPDAIAESNETVLVTLFSPTNALVGAASTHALTILDDDGPPPEVAFAAATSTATEGAYTLNIPVLLASPYGLPASVAYAIVGGTASNGADYVLSTGVLSYAAGQILQSLSVPLLDDAQLELTESLTLGLYAPLHAALGAITNHTISILDDEGVRLSIAVATASGGESVSPVTVTVSLSAAAPFPVSVDLAAGGSAQADSDFTLATGTLIVPAGRTSTNLTMAVINDDTPEPNETVLLTLSNPTNALLGTPIQASYQILDDDFQVIYVDHDAAGANNGTSWANAYTSLATALANPPAFAQYWVAAGVYTPGTSTNSTFSLPANATLFGGFAGNETATAQRDREAHPTILSGDLGGNDAANWSNRADNAVHVVTCVSSNVIFDGFVVRGGNAGNDSVFVGNNQGGGLWANLTRSLHLRHCVFVDNAAAAGGGLYLRRVADVHVEDCIFSGNLAREVGTDRGSGAAGGEGSSLTNLINHEDVTFTRCRFTGNTAPGGRGGVLFATTTGLGANFENCLIAGNAAGDFAGGVYARAFDMQIRNCTFSGNAPEAVYARDATPAVLNSILWGDTVEIELFNNTATVALSDLDQAGYEGNGNIRIDPRWLAAPSGVWAAGATYDPLTGTTRFQGGPWVADEHRHRTLNPDTRQTLQFLVRANSTNTLEVWGDASALGTAGAPFRIYDYTLRPDSPCVDVVPAAQAPAVDIDGTERPQGLDAEMGAYELESFRADFSGTPREGFAPLTTVFSAVLYGAVSNGFFYRWDLDGNGSIDAAGADLAIVTNTYTQPGVFDVALSVSNSEGKVVTVLNSSYIVLTPPVMYVSLDGGHVWPYADWASAATNISDALHSAIDGVTILVSNGTFILDAPLDIQRGITLRGAFGRDESWLDGRGQVRCIQISHTNALVEAFTIVAGFADNGGGAYLSFGGELRDCIVANSGATADGGGVYLDRGGTVRDSIILRNSAGDSGGGLYLMQGGTVEHCEITNNSTVFRGGGAYLDQGGAVRNSLVIDNTAEEDAGGVYLLAAGMVEDSVLTWNHAGDEGGGAALTGAAYLRGCTLENNVSVDDAGGALCGNRDSGIPGGALYECRITGNTSSDNGGGIYLWTDALAVNCLVVSNRSLTGGGAYCRDGGTFQNCSIVGNTAAGYGGGLGYRNGGTSRNTIIYHNTAGLSNPDVYAREGSHTFLSVCAPITLAGSGNFTNAPALVSSVAPIDAHLTAASPCIDAGTALNSPALDLDGIARPQDGNSDSNAVPDLGAFEYIAGISDADGDGLPDAWESAHGLSPSSSIGDDGPDGDPDGDGALNSQEYQADTEPNNPDSVLALTGLSVAGSNQILTWQGGTAAEQVVEYSENRSGPLPPWVILVSNPPPTLTQTNLFRSGTTNAAGYYRLRAYRP